MTDITSTMKIYSEPLSGNSGKGNVRRIYAVAPTTTDTGDTFIVNLSTYASGNFLGLDAFKHSTENSVIVPMVADATTSVTSGVLTVTIGGSTNEKSVYKILIGDGF